MSIPAYVIYALFLLSEIAISRRRAKTDAHQTDQHSLLLLWIAIAGSIAAAVLVALNVALPIAYSGTVHYAGLALMVLGILLRWRVVGALGSRFTAAVAIQPSHTLKTDGIYRYLRHPSYAALLLILVGLGGSLNNWVSLALIFFNAIGALLYRIRVEEAALTAHFGQHYLDYKRTTKALIPFVY